MVDKSRENKFKLIGGLASLDFINTVGGRLHSGSAGRPQAEIREEKLSEYEDLLAWSRKTGLMSQNEVKALERQGKEDPKTARAVLKRAVELREVIYRLFKAAIENWRPDAGDLKKLNEELLRARKRETLVHDQRGFHFEWGNEGVPLDKMLWMVAQSAADILTSDKLSRVKQCGGERCGWVFWDSSRSGNRTWCDMRDCGNLAKVHRFRQKPR